MKVGRKPKSLVSVFLDLASLKYAVYEQKSHFCRWEDLNVEIVHYEIVQSSSIRSDKLNLLFT